MKSEFLKLIKSDYVHVAYEAAIGAIAAYALPILYGQGVFNWQSAKAALIGAVILGARKGITLWLTNSNGEVLKPEQPK